MVSTVRAGVDRDAEFLQPVARGVRDPPDGDQHRVERDAHLAALVLRDQHLLAVFDQEPLGRVVDPDVDAVGVRSAA